MNVDNNFGLFLNSRVSTVLGGQLKFNDKTVKPQQRDYASSVETVSGLFLPVTFASAEVAYSCVGTNLEHCYFN